MLKDIIKDYIKEGKIKGFFITDVIFETPMGIRKRILGRKELVTMETLFEERDQFTDDEQQLVIEILEEMMNIIKMVAGLKEMMQLMNCYDQMTI